MPVETRDPLHRDRLTRLRGSAETIAGRLPGLLVEADRVAATVSQGVHGRRRTGVGETFWQFRPYQAGDSTQQIDWRQSAKSRDLFVREQEWEAAESVWLWVDQSPSMHFRSERKLPFKDGRAVQLALALASLLVRGGERVALLGADARPAGGRHGLNRLGEHLLMTANRAEALPPLMPLPRHARLCLISDFLAEPGRLRARLGGFGSMGLSASVVQIADPAEEELPFEGRVVFEGLEGEGRALFGSVAQVRDRYRRVYAAHREEIRQLVQRQGWSFTVHRTDDSAENGLLGLFQMLAPRSAA